MTTTQKQPHTGSADCDRWIQKTFQRMTFVSTVQGREVQQMVIKLSDKRQMILTEEQLSGLIYYLRTTFCKSCGGTGFDPDTLNGKCEYCSDFPF